MAAQMTLDDLLAQLTELRATSPGEALVTFLVKADTYYEDSSEPVTLVYADGATVVLEGKNY